MVICTAWQIGYTYSSSGEACLHHHRAFNDDFNIHTHLPVCYDPSYKTEKSKVGQLQRRKRAKLSRQGRYKVQNYLLYCDVQLIISISFLCQVQKHFTQFWTLNVYDDDDESFMDLYFYLNL